MNSTWTKLENSTGELKVSCSGAQWETAQKKAYNKIAKNIKIDGFRQGQAPKHLVAKQVSDKNVMLEAVDFVAGECLAAGLKEHELSLVTRPELDVEAISVELVSLVFKCTVKPTVILGKYKDLKIQKDVADVDAKEVDNEIDQLRENMAELILKEGSLVENGNTVIMDFKGFLNEVAFEGGAGENHSLEIGSGSFIPGFEEQLIGMETNSKQDIFVTFPENYQAEHLAGQQAKFEVEIKEIKEKHIPIADDEFALSVQRPEVTTLDGLKTKLKEELIVKKQNKIEEKYQNDLLDQIVEGSSVEIPEIMITDETDYMYRDFINRLTQQGYNEELYFQLSGQTKEQLNEQFAKDASNKVKLRLVLEAIAKVEKVEIADEEVAEEYQNIAKQYQMTIDKVHEAIARDTLVQDLSLRKAMNIITTSASK